MNKPFTIIISLLLTLIIGITLVWPKYQDLKTLEQKILQKRTELQFKEEYFSKIRELSQELKKYPTSLSKIDSILPSISSPPDLLNFLEKTGSQSGLILKNISRVNTQPLKEGSGVKVHSLSLSFAGPYPAFKNFLSSLEKSARLIETDVISLSALEENLISFDLKIKFYSY